jgi:dipeptidyl aminopeptidase/acylaminoacyl peptidase
MIDATPVAVAAASGAGSAKTAPGIAVQQPLSIQALLSQQRATLNYSQVSIAANGALAFQVTRSPLEDPRGENTVEGFGHLAVFAVPQGSTKATDIAKKIRGCDWFDPLWSPDGKSLLLKSTLGGQLRLWSWRPGESSPRKLSERRVNFTGQSGKGALWLDDQRVLLATSAGDDDVPYPNDAPSKAERYWSIAASGRQPSASELSTENNRLKVGTSVAQDLWIINTISRREEKIASNVFDFSLSPNRRFVVLVTGDSASTRDDGKMENHPSPSVKLTIIDLASRKASPIDAGNAADFEFTWSEDAQWLAVRASGTGDGSVKLFAWNVNRSRSPTGEMLRLKIGHLDVPSLRDATLNDSGELVVRGKEADPAGKPDGWYKLREGLPPELLTGDLPYTPDLLLLGKTSDTFISVGGGQVTRLRPEFHEVESLMRDVERLSRAPVLRTNAGTTIIIHAYGSSSRTGYYRFNSDTLEHKRIDIPDAGYEGAVLIVPSLNADKALVFARGSHGDAVFLSSEVSNTILWAANSWREKLELGVVQGFHYTALDGQPLNGCVLLPAGYQAGRKYPTIVWVYQSFSYRSDCSELRAVWGDASLEAPPPIALQVASAYGYAVLFPSMPYPKDRTQALKALPDGVLPAIDRVVADGIADKDRVFVAGQSNGGYSVLGLIGQTDRFKAAAEESGFSDLLSYWGTSANNLRYGKNLPEMFFKMEMAEHYNPGLGIPAWDDPKIYLENSPLFFAPHINTPVLLMHGDMDIVPIEQDEEMFAALLSQGKIAHFVRYFGEPHVFASPANVLDAWCRMLSWFDRFGGIQRDHSGDIVFAGETAQQASAGRTFSSADFLRVDTDRTKAINPH